MTTRFGRFFQGRPATRATTTTTGGRDARDARATRRLDEKIFARWIARRRGDGDARGRACVGAGGGAREGRLAAVGRLGCEAVDATAREGRDGRERRRAWW